MYEVFCKKKEILIWCFLPMPKKKNNKRSAKSADRTPTGKKTKDDSEAVNSSVAAVIETLKGKHGKAFTLEQYNAWAQLVNMGKHMSTDEPPQYPFLVGRSKTKVADSTAKANPSKGSFSPGKRIQLRTELLDQMQKLSSLLERGDISQDQYVAMKVMIMNDISETK